ncbi:TIGR03986 family CRISPR-associated RAMP protein [Nitrosovibrio sp. Nv17]|uniref:TIGR03986 family type III CRISPR-associated RAMP protein n=1 Tax=Nitrosovibrio sp. Nv17 TaxID=1855339 RepID=UPI000908B2C3|nr:TIGR03986 family CRISPR-associated RAMP protein [Nitrosovibrio sp. Nv17]SFW22776.1 CRISPR-associated protein [Nitrosovibrio sp. Nv17]
MMPRHVNPTSADRPATAPYNFVPLPERIFDVADGIEVDGKQIKPWEMHDCFVAGTFSGHIDLTIETLTPLFVRGAVRKKRDGSWDDRDSRRRPEPYMTPDGRPAIPGSSLRGMVRTLVEILSFSKMQPISDAKPFFRTVADDRIGRTYRSRMTVDGQKPRGGILHLDGSGASIQPREVRRVQRDALTSIQFDPRDPNYTPPWPPQHGRCWVRVMDASDVSDIRLQDQQPVGTGWRAATLVLTGNAPRKKREFVFLDPEGDGATPVRIPDSLLARFHDDDQITSWQERAFPRDRPQRAGRAAAGRLRQGEPVFFVLSEAEKSEDNPDGLVFFGRAGMFRFPYDRTPRDLVPASLRESPLDLAEAMFGKVSGGEAIKGRVHFSDAVATSGGPPWCEAVLVPHILSAPKPTTFQHYITQDGTKGRDQLTTYIDRDHTTIRGHKLYWHRDDGSGLAQIKEAQNHDGLLRDLWSANPGDTQHTIIQPVKKGVTLAGKIRFENLTPIELGALLHALDLPDGCAHRLGMGKPLGLGSIRIGARLQLFDSFARYRSWHAAGLQASDGNDFCDAFEKAILGHAQQHGEATLDGQEGLQKLARLDALFRLLEWEGRPKNPSTAYMELARFRDRPVLPTPHAIAGAGEPPWPVDPPRPGGGGRGSGAVMRRPDGDRSRSTSAHDMNVPPRPAPSAPAAPKSIQKGQTRPGTLKRSGTAWVAVFDGDAREAEVINSQKIDPSCVDGTNAEFYITEQSKRTGIKCRFERTTKG